MKTIPAKTILSSYEDSGWFGSNFTMNIYKGCCHGCIYCDSRSDCYHVENFDEVRAKENALSVIENDLRSKRKKGTVMTGSMSDPYNPFEKEYKLTRGALQLIQENGFGLIVNTKSPLVVRDADLLQKIRKHSPVAVNITITTADDELCRKIERNVPPSSDRLEAIKVLSHAGIPCGVLLMPLLPHINDTAENITAIIERAKTAGALWIYNGWEGFMGVTLRRNQRDYYLKSLAQFFPCVLPCYQKQYGNSYYCNSPAAKELWELYCSRCNYNNLLYQMDDIIHRIHDKYRMDQLRFF